MTWMPRFAEKLVEEARLPFYAFLGRLMGAFLEKWNGYTWEP